MKLNSVIKVYKNSEFKDLLYKRVVLYEMNPVELRKSDYQGICVKNTLVEASCGQLRRVDDLY